MCAYCKSVVARHGDQLAAMGKMGQLLEIPTPFTLGRTGSWHGVAFEVVGRLQMDRSQEASAPWQEIAIAFAGQEQTTWVAYAQGRWYSSSEVAAPPGHLPPLTELHPERQLALGPHGTWTVAEVGQRRVVSGEGAVGAIAPGAVTGYADIAAPGQRFGTIDYGDGSGPPVLYLGNRFDPSVVRFDDGLGLEAPTMRVTAVECPNCGASFELMSSAAERIVCQYCFVASDVSHGGLAALGPAPRPPYPPKIALGKVGLIHGNQFIVTAFVARSCQVDGVRYPWEEYLLFGGEQLGYRWLTVEEGKWQLVEPLEVGDVQRGPSGVIRDGVTYAPKQEVLARVDYVVGELYWKVSIGDTATAAEYERGHSGNKISRELTRTEVNYSAVRKAPREVLTSFGVAAVPSYVRSHAYQPRRSFKWMWWLALPALLFGSCFVLVASGGRPTFEDVIDGDIELEKKERKALKKLFDESTIRYDDVTVYERPCGSCRGIVIRNGHVTQIDLGNVGLKSIDGLGELPKLVTLSLPNNQVSDIADLCDAEALKEIDLSFNRIETIDDMSDCDALEKLHLENNRIVDLGGLHGLERLTELELENNPIRSVDGFGDLPRITSIALEAKALKSLEGIGPWPSLVRLTVGKGKLESLKGVDRLESLESLNVSHNAVSSLAGIGRPKSLTRLDLSHNPLASLAGIEALTGLTSLNLTGTKLTSVAELSGLSGLTTLALGNNQLTSLRGLGELPELETLDVGKNRITTLDGIAPMPKVKTLDLGDNPLTSLQGLAAFPNVTTLSVDRTNLTSVADLEHVPKVTKLEVGHNALTSLAGVDKLGGLLELRAPHNQVVDLAPLAALTLLATLDLSHNQVQSIAPLKELTSLANVNISNNKVDDVNPLGRTTPMWSVDASNNQIVKADGFFAMEPLNFDLSGNPGSFTRTQKGTFAPAPVVSPSPAPYSGGSTGSGSRSPSSRYRSSGGTSLGK